MSEYLREKYGRQNLPDYKPEPLPPVAQKVAEDVKNIMTAEFPEKLESNRSFSFSETVILLRREGYDLELERAKIVEAHERCGIVQAHIDKGIVKDAREYSDLFNSVQFTGKGINNLIEEIRRVHLMTKDYYSSPRHANDKRSHQEKFEEMNYNLLPVFNTGCLSLWELVELFKKMNVEISTDEDDIFDSRKIEATEVDVQRLEELGNDEAGDWEKKHVLMDAFRKAPELVEQKPRLFFTSTMLEERSSITGLLKRVSADNQLQMIDPVSDMVRLMTQYSRKEEFFMKNEDRDEQDIAQMYFDWGNTLYYPLQVLPSGLVLTLKVCTFGLYNFHLYLVGDFPGYVENDSGTRVVLYE